MIREALSAAADALRAAGVEDARLDAEVLLAEATGWDRARLAAHSEDELPPDASRRFAEMVRRRLRREPVAYIVGRKGFCEIELCVDPRVLIPRPETELLVELALAERPRRVLDVGTGSGAIALAVASELPDCEVVATDTSAPALEVARANAERLGLSERIELIEGTLPDGYADFDLVLANLPYVADADWPHLEPEVTEWEPREALLAGPDGLEVIYAFIDRLRLFPRYTRKKAKSAGLTVGLEVGAGQANAVGEMMGAIGFEEIELREDLAGVERVVVGRR